MQAAGVPTQFKEFDGTFHGFMFYEEVPQAVEAMSMSVQALRAAFGVHEQP